MVFSFFGWRRKEAVLAACQQVWIAEGERRIVCYVCCGCSFRRPIQTDYVIDEETLNDAVLSPDSHDSGINVEVQYSRPMRSEDTPPVKSLPSGWERHEGTCIPQSHFQKFNYFSVRYIAFYAFLQICIYVIKSALWPVMFVFFNRRADLDQIWKVGPRDCYFLFSFQNVLFVCLQALVLSLRDYGFASFFRLF